MLWLMHLPPFVFVFIFSPLSLVLFCVGKRRRVVRDGETRKSWREKVLERERVEKVNGKVVTSYTLIGFNVNAAL